VTERLVLRQGTQFRDDALTIGFISADLRPSAEGGGVTVRLTGTPAPMTYWLRSGNGSGVTTDPLNIGTL